MEIHSEVLVDAPAADAWRVIGEQFGEISEWTMTLTESSLDGELGVGATRTCAGPGFGPIPGGEVTEQPTEFDRDAMTLSYVGSSGLPWFITEAGNTWWIESLGPDQCRVHSDATLQLQGWLRPVAAGDGTFFPTRRGAIV